jgi:hypothetical protein
MKKASVTAKQYTSNIQAGTGSAQSYAEAQKANNAALKSVSVGAGIASKAVKLLSATMNTLIFTAVFTAISKGIQWVSGQISDYIHRNEIAIEKAEELLNTFNSELDDITSKQSTLEGLESEFNKLSKGVDDYGKNVSLTADEYERYQDIVETIVGVNPSLITGWDEEGNILARKNDLLEDSIQLLKDEYQQKIKNMALPDNIGTAIDGAVGRYSTAKNKFYDVSIPNNLAYSGTKIDDNGKEQSGYIHQIYTYIGDVIGEKFDLTKYSSIQDYIFKNADAVFNNLDKIKERAAETKDGWKGLTDSQIIDLMDYFRELRLAYNDMNTAATSANSTLQYVAMAEDSYAGLTDKQKVFISDYINGIKITAETTEQEKDAIRKSIISITNELANHPDASQLFEDLYTLPKDELPADEYIAKYKQLVEDIIKALDGEDGTGLSEEQEIEIRARFNIVDDENSINTMKEELKDKVQGDLGTLSLEDLKIAYEKIDFGSGIISLEELIVKIEEYKNSLQDANEMTVSLSDLSTASEALSSLSKAFKELNDDGYITTDTITKIKEATGLGEEQWKKYESTLLKADSESDEFKQTMSDLAYTILENKLGTQGLANATKEQINAILRENGLLYDLEMAEDACNKALVKLTASTIAFGNADMGVDEKVNKMKELAVSAGVASQAVADALDPNVLGRRIGNKGISVVDYVYEKLFGEKPKDIQIDPNHAPSSTKNEAFDNYLKEAESRYKIHQDETRYIKELNTALKEYAKTDEERLEITEKINEAYRDLADNRIKDLEHQIDLKKELYGEDYNSIDDLNNIQILASKEAERLRKMGYDNNSNEIQDLQKTWWDAENRKLDFYSKQHEKIIRDIEHARDMAVETNPYADTTSYYKQLQDEYHKEADRLRALDPERYKEEIQKLQDAWWDAQSEIADWSLSNSKRWIDERNAYNDWAKYADSEVEAWKRVLERFRQEYPNELEKIKEIEENYFNARKEEFEKYTDFGTSYFGARKTLLQSYYDVTNAIAEAQHEINKELEASKTMYEYLDKDTRKLLFNQEDYNSLSKELIDIQSEADRLKRQYEYDLDNATLDTVEKITSNYEMQYETLMRSYEIAKADLDIAKKKAKLNNVLNERNVRMFIDGQWQWVANTEDVANAKAELADAEYARKTAEAGARQTDAINALTLQENQLAVVINKFKSGVIDLDTAIGLAEEAIGKLSNVSSGNSTGAKSGTSSIVTGTSNVSVIKSQMAKNSAAWHGASDSEKRRLEAENQALGKLIDSDYDPASGSWTHKYANGTGYTQSGRALMGENGDELFIDSNGHLIPINQPTIADISSGGIVFNPDQMKNLRALWDMSNFNLSGNSSYINTQPQQTNQTYDNRIIINGLTVDGGTPDGQAFINMVRRFVGNH